MLTISAASIDPTVAAAALGLLGTALAAFSSWRLTTLKYRREAEDKAAQLRTPD